MKSSRARVSRTSTRRARAMMDARGVTTSPRRPPRGARDGVATRGRGDGVKRRSVGHRRGRGGRALGLLPRSWTRGRGDIRCHPIYSIHSIHSTHSIGLARGWTSVYSFRRSSAAVETASRRASRAPTARLDVFERRRSDARSSNVVESSTAMSLCEVRRGSMNDFARRADLRRRLRCRWCSTPTTASASTSASSY